MQHPASQEGDAAASASIKLSHVCAGAGDVVRKDAFCAAGAVRGDLDEQRVRLTDIVRVSDLPQSAV